MWTPKRELYIRVYGRGRVATYRPGDCVTMCTGDATIIHNVLVPLVGKMRLEAHLLLSILNKHPLCRQNHHCETYMRQMQSELNVLQKIMNELDEVCNACGLRNVCTNVTLIVCRDEDNRYHRWIFPGQLNNYVTDFRLSEAETYGLTEIIAEKMKVDIIYATALFLITSLYFIYGTPAILTTLYLIAFRIFIELLIRSSKHEREQESVSYIGLEEVDDAGYFVLPRLGHESRITRSEYDKLFNLLRNIDTVQQLGILTCSELVSELIKYRHAELRRRKKWSYYKDMLIEVLHTALSDIKDFVVSLAT